LRRRFESQSLQKINLLRCRNLNPQQLVRLRKTQRNFLRWLRMRIRIYHAFGQTPARQLQYQLRRALAGPIANTHIATAFKAIR